MSRTRHTLRGFALEVRRGTVMNDHAFGWGQLVHAGAGVARVETATGHWVLPAARALWVPPGERHALHCVTDLSLRTLYYPSDRLPPLPHHPVVLSLSPLLRQLVLEAVARSPVRADDPRAQRLVAVLDDELAHAVREPLALPLPVDPAARRVAQRILASVGARRSLAQLCARAGASRRTLERRFRAETGTSLGAWRRQAQLQHALLVLGDGASVGEAAEACGYDSVSAFVVAFRLAFSETPGRWRAATEHG